MFPHGELTAVLARKAGLRRRIARSRLECLVNAAEVTRPIAWLDHAIETWRQMQPLLRLAVVPLGFCLMRLFGPRVRVLPQLLRWGPLVRSAFRVFTGPAK